MTQNVKARALRERFGTLPFSTLLAPAIFYAEDGVPINEVTSGLWRNSVRTLAADRLRWCILRGGRFVGPGTFEENTVAELRNGTRVIAGTGQNYLSLIHVADMAKAILAALSHAPDRSIFNIVDEPVREGDYLDRLADSIGANRPPRNAALPAPPSWRCSNHAARSILQWSPTHPIIP